ncbi:MAG: hypothetical protein ACNS63_07075 [Candidatus Nitrospinota bacterium M3_3B_026]
MVKKRETAGEEGSGLSGALLSSPAAPLAALFAISFALYAKTAAFGFIPTWDDGRLILDNPLLEDVSFENAARILGSSSKGFYQPLHIMSYMLDAALWEGNPAGYHLVNALLHSVNAALVFLAVRVISGRGGLSFFAALLFAVHPVNVENVAWAAERKTLLSALFFLLTVIFYVRGMDERGYRSYAASLICFTAALLSKVMVVTAPLALLAWTALLRKGEKRWARLAPFFVIAAGSAALTLALHLRMKVFEEGTLSPDILFGVVYPTMLPVLWKYVSLLALPFGLNGYYNAEFHYSFTDWPVLASLLAWAGVFAFVFIKGGAAEKFWFSWYWIFLLPAANIIPNIVFYADRFLYLPQIGAFVLLGALGGRLAEAVEKRKPARKGKDAPGGRPPLLVPAAAALALFYAALAFDRLDVWKNEITFWEDTAEKSPDMYKPRLNLGVAYEKAGRLKEAEAEYTAALRIYKGPEALSNLAMVRAKMKAAKGN